MSYEQQCIILYFLWHDSHIGLRPHYLGFTITLRHDTFVRTSLVEWSARHRDLYLKKTQHSQETDIRAPGEIWIYHASKRTAADPSMRPRGRRLHSVTTQQHKTKVIPTRLIALIVTIVINPLKPELNPICYLLALLGAHHFLHVSRIRVKLLTLRRLMSYIYIWSTHSWCF